MKILIKGVLIFLLFDYVQGQIESFDPKFDSFSETVFSIEHVKVDSLEFREKVIPVIPGLEIDRAKEQLTYPLSLMTISFISALYYQTKANSAYSKYQRYYFFPEKSSVYKKKTDKFDDISSAFYLTFEVSVIWAFNELIRLE